MGLHCRSRWPPPSRTGAWAMPDEGRLGRASRRRLRRSCQLHIELPLHCRPVEVCVLSRNETVGDCDHVNALTCERLALRGSAHPILADEVSIADVDPALLEAEVGRSGERGGKCLPRRCESRRRLAEPMKMEDRVVGVHGEDRVEIVLRPGGAVPSGQLLGYFDAHRVPSGRVRANVTDPGSGKAGREWLRTAVFRLPSAREPDRPRRKLAELTVLSTEMWVAPMPASLDVAAAGGATSRASRPWPSAVSASSRRRARDVGPARSSAGRRFT